MSSVLFVKANDRQGAVSLRLYEAFLKSYQETHPSDTVTELDLFNTELPYYDNTTITALYKQGQGIALSNEEQRAAETVGKYLDQFLAADKVVIAFPLWNFTIPAQLVTYLSYLAQAGKTFKYTAEGPVGLAGDKKVVLLNARGGIYSEGPMAGHEMAVNYVKNMLGFWGITNVETVVVEGHNQFQDRAEQIVADGVAKASQVAASF